LCAFIFYLVNVFHQFLHIGTNTGIFFLFRRRELNVTVLEANIQHLKSSTRYVIHVFAFNSYGYSDSPASLTVQTQAEGKLISNFGSPIDSIMALMTV